jgi:hypothetical protein
VKYTDRLPVVGSNPVGTHNKKGESRYIEKNLKKSILFVFKTS